MNVIKFIRKLVAEASTEADGSIAINDVALLKRFTSDPDFPFLVSFPRTGSHWLRMIIELYFERPLLTRTFFNVDSSDYLLFHTHDLDLDIYRDNVIYLYRDPVDTVFSQLMYHQQNITDESRISYWADLYGRHLYKWLCSNDFSSKFTAIRYEMMRDVPHQEFKKVCEHFAMELDAEKLSMVLVDVTKERVNAKTRHDPQVVNMEADYTEKREKFRGKSEAFVWDRMLMGREGLKSLF